ncbi:hypothetical protein ACFQU1_20905 [Chelatococcus sp. GCM10030263]|uniref:hypothetical protein n=1 Tax=Chelatococcus sp. GCM10030263 TaxID=3273387 RepID=UPI00361135D5
MTSPTPDEAAAVRRRRAEGASIARIMAETGLGRRAVAAMLAAAEEGAGAPALSTAIKKRGATARNPAARTPAAPKTTRKATALKAAARQGPSKAAAVKSPTRKPAMNLAESPTPSGDRGALVSRLWHTAEAQLREVARHLKDGVAEPSEREKDARTLAVLVKTLRELIALEAERQAGAAPSEEESDVRDLDDFRRELAERIDRLRQARDADGAAGDL